MRQSPLVRTLRWSASAIEVPVIRATSFPRTNPISSSSWPCRKADAEACRGHRARNAAERTSGPVITTSALIVTPQTRSNPSTVSGGRGATVVLQCAICHGARGLSQADTPNLAGQYAASIYKELQDFKSRARPTQ